MILSVDSKTDFVNTLYKMSGTNPYACRIISMYNSYNPDLVFVDYWLVLDEENKCQGAIARNGTAFIVYVTDKADLDEVSSFMRVAGASSILCDEKVRLDIYNSKSIRGAVLKKNSPFEEENEEYSFVVPDIKKAYELILKCADDNFTPPEFEDFYVDVNHRLRHNTMRICGIENNGELASVAMTVAESKVSGIIGALACNPSERNKGFGSATVKHITNELIRENKTVYLYRAENTNISFYNRLGFVETGMWKEYHL